MARSDYAHWNEEADLMWWMEEGRFGSDYEREYDPEDYLPGYDDEDDYDDEADEEIDPDDLVDLDADDNSVTYNESRYIEWD